MPRYVEAQEVVKIPWDGAFAPPLHWSLLSIRIVWAVADAGSVTSTVQPATVRLPVRWLVPVLP